MTCLSCHADTSNGLNLCSICTYKLTAVLDMLALHFRNLSRWRPARADTSRPVPGSRPPAGALTETTDDAGEHKIDRALSEVSSDLSTWAGKLVYHRTDLQLPDRDHEADTATDTCTLLSSNLATIATLEWAGDLVTRASAHENRLRKLSEQLVPGWYAGACRRCASPTHVIPGHTWVTCGTCGVTTAARDHLETILDEARDWVASPRRIAEALVCLLDGEPSINRLHERIRKWGTRGPDHGGVHTTRRVDEDGDPVGPKLYRLGDVLDRMFTDLTLPSSAHDTREPA